MLMIALFRVLCSFPKTSMYETDSLVKWKAVEYVGDIRYTYSSVEYIVDKRLAKEQRKIIDELQSVQIEMLDLEVKDNYGVRVKNYSQIWDSLSRIEKEYFDILALNTEYVYEVLAPTKQKRIYR